jgi:methylase of polypeptide subunit release factors
MDIFHTIFLEARGQKLHDAPIQEPVTEETRILDIGTGTGIWAIDMAE